MKQSLIMIIALLIVTLLVSALIYNTLTDYVIARNLVTLIFAAWGVGFIIINYVAHTDGYFARAVVSEMDSEDSNIFSVVIDGQQHPCNLLTLLYWPIWWKKKSTVGVMAHPWIEIFVPLGPVWIINLIPNESRRKKLQQEFNTLKTENLDK